MEPIERPERYVWAALDDVERTAQRGARWTLLGDLIMNMELAAPILGITAVVLLAIAACRLLGPAGRVGGPNATPEPTPTAIPTPLPTPTLRPVTSLDQIALDEGLLSRGFTLDNTYRNAAEIATYPVRSARATDLALREVATLQGGVATEFRRGDGPFRRR